MKFWYCFFGIAIWGSTAVGGVQVAAPFGDHMVLQRGMKIPIWGSAAEGQTITVTFAGQTKQGKANRAGRWHVVLDPLKASNESQTLTIQGGGRIELTDVLVGEVWLASGQSNMQYSLSKTEDGKAALPEAMHSQIRIYQRPIGKRGRDEWMACTPRTAAELSAVAYFFSKHLHEKLNVPIGIIVRAVGGTTIQRWVAPESIENNELIQKHMAEAKRRSQDFARYETERVKYDKRNKPSPEIQQFLTEMGQLAFYRGAGLGGLYGRMIQPLQPFAIRGVIWYQGEFNNRSGQAYDYREWQSCLVRGWRKAWGQGDFPFLFVQMQVLGNATTALLRESQTTTLDRCPNTAMAVICDQSAGLHPPYKNIAGERLAMAARSLAYQETMPPMGPILKSHHRENGKVILTFRHVGEGLKAKGGHLKGFMAAGADEKFHPAQARIISRDQVEVSSELVPQPAAVRYAWLKDPRQVMTLFNSTDLPASPFRTDEFSSTGSLEKRTMRQKKRSRNK